MSRDKFIDDLVSRVTDGNSDSEAYSEVYQRRPYTFAIIQYGDIKGLGFTKVARPDKWDAAYGIELATRKAAAHIYRQVNGE
jgi:hypothetical protein